MRWWVRNGQEWVMSQCYPRREERVVRVVWCCTQACFLHTLESTATSPLPAYIWLCKWLLGLFLLLSLTMMYCSTSKWLPLPRPFFVSSCNSFQWSFTCPLHCFSPPTACLLWSTSFMFITCYCDVPLYCVHFNLFALRRYKSEKFGLRQHHMHVFGEVVSDEWLMWEASVCLVFNMEGNTLCDWRLCVISLDVFRRRRGRYCWVVFNCFVSWELTFFILIPVSAFFLYIPVW